MSINKEIIKELEESEIEKAALFISKINSDRSQHIGYCGTDSKEIEASIKEIYSETDNKYFIASYKNDCISGIIGFEPDDEKGTAEIWGPFVWEQGWTIIADKLWNEIIKILPESINEMHMFYNYHNSRCIDFAIEHGFVKNSEWFILTYDKQPHLFKNQNQIQELRQQHYYEFELLHDTIFPNTYYSGKQITEKIDKENQVFVALDEGNVVGYIFVEANSEFNEGNIEFLGVNTEYRERGFGEGLVLRGLKWLIEYKNISNITLSVNSNNMAAIRIYKKVGFNEDNHMVFLKGNDYV